MYLDYFDCVYYINLDTRQDRMHSFEERARALNIPAKRFPAIVATDEQATPLYEGHIDPRRKYKMGCTMSHQAVVKLAKEANSRNCLIFEDDCVFLKEYEENIKECVTELKKIDWDLFYIGGEANNFCKSVSKNLSQVENGGVYCTHAYAINNTFYDKMLSINPNQVDTIDILYVNYDNSKRIAVLSKKLLAIQDKSYSDLWNTVTDSSEWMINSWNKYIQK